MTGIVVSVTPHSYRALERAVNEAIARDLPATVTIMSSAGGPRHFEEYPRWPDGQAHQVREAAEEVLRRTWRAAA